MDSRTSATVAAEEAEQVVRVTVAKISAPWLAAAVVEVMAVRIRLVMVAVTTGEASRTIGDEARAVAGATTTAVVAMNPEVMEVAVEPEVAWEEVTVVVASIDLVALGTEDHITTLNRVIQTPPPSSCKA